MRCHFSIIFEKTGKFLTFWILLALSQADKVISIITSPDFAIQDLKIIFPACAVLLFLLLLVMGYQFMIWRKTFLYLDDNTFVVERNTLNRKKDTFGITNISNINLEQNLFERIVGTHRLKLDVDSFSTSNGTNISIVLSTAKAENLKAALLSHMNTEIISTETEEDAPSIPFASVGDIISHCFFSISAGFLSLALAFIVGIPLFFYFSNLSFSDLFYTEGMTGFWSHFIPIFFLIIGYAFQLLKQLLSFYHFCCFRKENDLIIRYGFFRKQDFTIPVERINALRITQPPIARIAGRMQAQLLCIGMGDTESEKNQLTLCMKKHDFYKHLQELLPEFSSEYAEDVIYRRPKGSNAVYILSTLLYTLCFSIPVSVLAFSFLPTAKTKYIFWGLYGIILLSILLYRLFHYFCLGIHSGTEYLTICNGSFEKQITIIPQRKLQFATFEENPLCRLFNIKKGSVHILGSPGNNTFKLPFLSPKQVQELRTVLRRSASR